MSFSDIFVFGVFQGGDILFLRKLGMGVVLGALVLNLTAVSLSAAQDKIGFIDTQRVLMAHPKYEASQKHLDEFVKQKIEEARAAAEKEQARDKRMEIINAARRESGDEEFKVMNPINEEINKVIESAAKAKGVTVVLNKVFIYFGGIDMTEDVIKGVRNLK
jgi:outer membrane protein